MIFGDYYFYRELDHRGNLQKGKTFHSCGIVDEIYEFGVPGKQVVISHLDIFNITVTTEWLGLDEVELFEVDKDTYVEAKKLLEKIDNLIQE